jgi:hypothetical protein
MTAVALLLDSVDATSSLCMRGTQLLTRMRIWQGEEDERDSRASRNWELIVARLSASPLLLLFGEVQAHRARAEKALGEPQSRRALLNSAAPRCKERDGGDVPVRRLTSSPSSNNVMRLRCGSPAWLMRRALAVAVMYIQLLAQPRALKNGCGWVCSAEDSATCLVDGARDSLVRVIPSRREGDVRWHSKVKRDEGASVPAIETEPASRPATPTAQHVDDDIEEVLL